MLNDIASNTSFFGIFITGVAYVLACAIQKRFKASILNPLLDCRRCFRHMFAGRL